MKHLSKHLVIGLFLMTTGYSHANESLSYTGRLVNADGSPVSGDVDLRVELAYTNDVSLIICSKIISPVPLANGVFHIKIAYTTAECGGKATSEVLAEAPAGETAALRVTDLTNTKTYSFHAINPLPYSVVAKTISSHGATAGQILSWNGTKWAPIATGGSGTVTSVATGAGLTGGPITTTGTISIIDGGVTAAKLNQMGAAVGQVLKWTAGGWTPSADTDTGITSETDPNVLGFAKNAPETCLLDKQALHYDALLNSGAGGLYCKNVVINSDDITEGTTKLFFTDARAKSATVADAINDATTDVAPSQNAVFDALAGKQATLGSTSDVEVRSLGVSTSTPGAKLGVAGTLSAAAGTEYGMKLFPTINQSATAGYTALFMNVTETATGSGLKKLLDLQVDGVSKFSVDSTGAVVSSTATSGTTANYTSAGGNQLTVGYDGSNKTTMNVDSLGFTTFNASGTGGQGFNFTGGNVGIGAAIPTEALDVTGSVKASVGVKAPLLSNATDLTLTADSDNNASGALIFNTGTNERIRVLNNGNVGIGSDTPYTQLVVRNKSGTTDSIGVLRSDTSPNLDIYSSYNGDDNVQTGSFAYGVRPSDNAWQIWEKGLNVDWKNLMTVLPTGSVGIGTTSPSSYQHGGSVRALELHNSGTTSDSQAHYYVSSASNIASSAIGGLTASLTNTSDINKGVGYIGFITTSTNTASTPSSDLYFATRSSTESNWSTKMIVGGNGNVGIGTTSPRAPLDIGTQAGAGGNIRLGKGSTTEGGQITLDDGTGTGAWEIDTNGADGSEYLRFFRDKGENNITAMVVSTAGYVGVGTTAPSAKLHVKNGGINSEQDSTGGILGSISVSGRNTSSAAPYYSQWTIYNMREYGAGNSGMQFYEYYDNNNNGSLCDAGDVCATRMTIAPGGNVGIGTTAPGYKLDVVGDINASGSVRSAGSALTSDIRLKENLTPVKDSLEKLSTLKAYNYYWKDKKKFSDQKQLGLVAQEVEKVFPEAVLKGSDGFLAVSYANLVAPLIESVKQLYGQFRALYERVGNSEHKIAAIEAKLKANSRVPASIEQQNKELRTEVTELKTQVKEIPSLKAENAALKAYLCQKDPAASFCKSM